MEKEVLPMIMENVTGDTLSALAHEVNLVVSKLSGKGYTLRGIPHVSVDVSGFYTTLMFDKCDDEVKPSEQIEILTSQGVKRLGHEATSTIKEFSGKGYTLRGIPHVAPNPKTGSYYTLLLFEKL